MPRKKKIAARSRVKRGGGPSRDRRSSDQEVDFTPFAGTSRSATTHKHEGIFNQSQGSNITEGVSLGLFIDDNFPGFTLQSEALNTQRHHSWSANQNLRNSKINFISGGDLNPPKSEESEAVLADLTLEEPAIEQEAGEASMMPTSNQHGSLLETGGEDLDEPNQFIVDVEGGPPIITGLQSPRIHSTSPTPSSSSDELIVFAGRDRSGKGLRRSTPVKRHHFDRYDAKIKIVEDKIQERRGHLARTIGQIQSSSQLEHQTLSITTSSSAAHQSQSPAPLVPCQQPNAAHHDLSTCVSRSRKPRRGSYLTKAELEKEELSILDDYIANMEEGGTNHFSSYNKRDLGGDDSSMWQETDASSEMPVRPPKSGRDRSLICENDSFAHAILSKRERKSGLQYLIAREGENVDEARWVSHASMIDPATIVLVEEFDAEQQSLANPQDEDEDDDDSTEDTDDEDLGDDDTDHSEDDAFDPLPDRMDRMSDKKLALLLARQAESQELMSIDDSADGEDGLEQEDPSSTQRHVKLVQRGARRPRPDHTAVTALADAYDGFDVMDFERPSLKKKPKNRKGKLAFDPPSDSDLEASQLMAWDNDRRKKKNRKQQREELRAQGLLGKASGKPDLKARYKEGMSIGAVKDEIKRFLIGSNTTLALPPMDKADRKLIHELANASNLKSKSVGKGNKRFPILYRTSRTSYDERAFIAVEARPSRRYLPRMDVNGHKLTKTLQRQGRGGSGITGVSYRDGDIVGASAPELGVENKGRAMLQRMGWSTGTALGALNNKGILQPVSHVVKTTKAGLG
ncbi:MAG: hypothetical protein M1818_003132 [Claussenomyces sp. TS43310]|nr:MAG: hypothetical protein M1818_003132 [Claussenomyces sp. TS43310]